MLLIWKYFVLSFSALLPLINPLGSALIFLGLVGSAPISLYKSLARRIAVAQTADQDVEARRAKTTDIVQSPNAPTGRSSMLLAITPMKALKMTIPATVTTRSSTSYPVPLSLAWVPVSIVCRSTL